MLAFSCFAWSGEFVSRGRELRSPTKTLQGLQQLCLVLWRVAPVLGGSNPQELRRHVLTLINCLNLLLLCYT